MKRVAFGLAVSFLAAGCIPAEISRLEFAGMTCQEVVSQFRAVSIRMRKQQSRLLLLDAARLREEAKALEQIVKERCAGVAGVPSGSAPAEVEDLVAGLAEGHRAGWEAYLRGDYAAVLREWRPLAEQGHAGAQFGLGNMYANGRGVPEDDTEAVRWYRLAAGQGYAWAQLGLGVMYANGRGVPEDGVQAYAWFSIAAVQGDDSAEHSKKLIAESMTREERAQARELARQYWEAYVLPFRQ